MEKEVCAVITLDSLFTVPDKGSQSGSQESESSGAETESYLPENLKIDLLKIDAEGYELGVLKGAEESLRATRFHFI